MGRDREGKRQSCVFALTRKAESTLYLCFSTIFQMLMHSLSEEEIHSNLAAINCSLIKCLYSLDCSMMVNVINFLSNTVNSEYYSIKRKSIKLALQIFTGEESQFATGFYKLWEILCER